MTQRLKACAALLGDQHPMGTSQMPVFSVFRSLQTLNADGTLTTKHLYTYMHKNP